MNKIVLIQRQVFIFPKDWFITQAKAETTAKLQHQIKFVLEICKVGYVLLFRKFSPKILHDVKFTSILNLPEVLISLKGVCIDQFTIKYLVVL